MSQCLLFSSPSGDCNDEFAASSSIVAHIGCSSMCCGAAEAVGVSASNSRTFSSFTLSFFHDAAASSSRFSWHHASARRSACCAASPGAAADAPTDNVAWSSMCGGTAEAVVSAGDRGAAAPATGAIASPRAQRPLSLSVVS